MRSCSLHKNCVLPTLISFILLLATACSGRGNIDLSKATPLTAEPVNLPPSAAGGAPGGNNDNTQYASLFSAQPGQWVPANKAGGTIDPVGTTLNEDFDGDGIPNNKETNTNIWVADYPEIEAEIAPPVTMKVEILKTGTSESSEINSDITSDELESRKNEGSEKFHQNELNDKTVQYEKETSSSSSSSSSNSSSTSSASASTTASASGGGGFGVSASAEIEMTVNVNVNQTSTSEHSFNHSSSERTQVFEDRPFKNNLDRSGTSVKADAAAKNARQYRRDKQSKKLEQYQTTPNGGQIRAALFIKNHSVNMPVRISNVLCSLLFETPQGVLIPVQSFRLRNDDFSLFEVEVYGGSEFGPYVVTLNNLNTVEIENALAQGYMPKIYIVDYQMTHVADSNYRAALAETFTGNNLKIIEENAKGRTALVKIFAPNFRRMFRVSAFDVQRNNMADDEACDVTSVYAVNPAKSPGISLRRALQRIACTGIPVEFGHYILDFTGTDLEPVRPMVYMYGVKSINGYASTVPCSGMVQGTLNIPASVTGDPGSKLTTTTGIVNACKIRVADLTEDQIFSLGLWTVFDNAKYYRSNKYLPNVASPAAQPQNQIYLYTGSSVETCGQLGEPCATPVIQGVESKVWAGDNYDVVYMKLSDILKRVKAQIVQFGTNPLETGAPLAFNTLWDKSTVGPNPFYPTVKSNYLGQAGLTDRIELNFRVDSTKFLNPNVGVANTQIPNRLSYSDFSYNYSPASRQNTTQLFDISEVIDFEINPGLGGTAAHWTNLRDITVSADAAVGTQWGNCGQSWDFIKQTFKLCIMVPRVLPGVDDDGLINLYLRPALSNATRNAIWPEPVAEIKRFQAQLVEFGKANQSVIQVYLGVGALATDGSEANAVINIGSEAMNVAASGGVTLDNRLFVVELTSALTTPPVAGDLVTVQGHAFTGTVKMNALAGDKTVRIIPANNATPALPLGALHTGKLITIGGSQYTIQVIRQYNKVYTIPLQYPLSTDHLAGEKTYLKPALSPVPQVQYSLDTGFVSAWNNAMPVPYGPLLPNQVSSCPSPFSATNCSGYAINVISSNWLGYGSFKNDWADASNLLKFNPDGTYNSSFSSTTEQSLFEISTTDVPPKKFSLGKFPNGVFNLTNDIQLNSAPGVRAAGVRTEWEPSYTPTAVSNGKIVSLFLQTTDGSTPTLMARVLDVPSKAAVGAGSTQISLNGQYIQSADIAIHNNIALIVYHRCDANWQNAVKGRYLDISTGNVLTSDFDIRISTSQSFCELAQHPVIAVDNQGKAIVAWSEYQYSYGNGLPHNEILAARLDLNLASANASSPGNTILNSAQRISASYTEMAYTPVITIFGNTALIGYHAHYNIPTAGVYGEVYATYLNTSTGNVISGLNGENYISYVHPESALQQLSIFREEGSSIVHFGWRQQLLTGGPMKAYAAFFDMATMTLVKNEFPVNLSMKSNKVFSTGNYAFSYGIRAYAANDCDIRVNVYPLISYAEQNTELVIPERDNACGMTLSMEKLSATKVLLVYHERNAPTDDGNVRGQIISLDGQIRLDGPSFIISQVTSGGQQFPSARVVGQNIVLQWLDQMVPSTPEFNPYSIRGLNLHASIRNLLEPQQSTIVSYPAALTYGPNTFFTAPLIERNYTVTSRIKF